MQKYFEKISGERLFLSPENPDDAALYTKWLNDPAVTVSLGGYAKVFSLPRTEREMREAVSRDHSYAIVLREGERLLGNIDFRDVDHLNGKATLGIFIGEEADRGQGYGAEATRLMLNYAFTTLHLHNVQLEVFSNNAQAIACYEKVGFKISGRRRESVFIEGGFVDEIYMDILDSEFLRNE